jgi:hypothetical protein
MPDTPEPAPETTEGAEPQQEDVKKAFREALERKQAQARQGQEHADARSKVDNSHGPASSKRTFRRKSG